jgi:tetratricopeptide (TPR) repeat protein
MALMHDLPQQGKDAVIELVQSLCASSKPLDVHKVNLLTGANLRIPGPTWRELDQQDRPSAPFGHVSFHLNKKLEPASGYLEIGMATTKCAIDKRTLIESLPHRSGKSPLVLGAYDDEPLTAAEVWTTDVGTLVLTFAESGLQVLKKIEWRAPRALDPDDLSDPWAQAELARRALTRKDFSMALDCASRAIALRAARKPAPGDLPPTLAECYRQRAEIFVAERKLELAIADTSSAVRIDGAYYLPFEVELLLKAGRRDDAIHELMKGIARSHFERERSSLRLLLAKLYLDNKEFSKAIDSAVECIRSEDQADYAEPSQTPGYMRFVFTTVQRMSAPATLIKAKAENALGKHVEARQDAEEAANKFLDIAQVGCRDRIQQWLKTLP